MEQKKCRIMIVEDEADIAQFIEDALSGEGYNVTKAKNGVDALDKLKMKPIDIVISDIQMPEMSGLELFEKLKEKNIPTILVTGFAKDFDISKAEEMGAADFLVKPFGVEEILNSIEIVAHQLNEKQSEMDDVDLDHNYCRVHIDDFVTGSKVGQDLYLRLSFDKYLRIAKADSPMSSDRILSYKKKGLNYLYIRKEDFAAYVGFNLKLAQTVSTGRAKVSKAQKLRLVRQTCEVYLENTFVNGIDNDSFVSGKALVETALRMATEADSIFEIIEMLKEHSDVTYAHCLGVALYSSIMAKTVGWTSASTTFKISMAGLLHDVGKKEIPRRILMKSRMERTPEEVQLYETHPTRGRELLAAVPCIPEEVIIATTQHHENMAGMGYPYRLPRLKIHLFSRIIAVANAFCNLALKGPYGNGMAPLQAIEKIFLEHENEFDLIFVRALMEIFKYPVPDRLKNLKMFGEVGKNGAA